MNRVQPWSFIDDARADVLLGNPHVCAAAASILKIRQWARVDRDLAAPVLDDALGVYRKAYLGAYFLPVDSEIKNEDGQPVDDGKDPVDLIAECHDHLREVTRVIDRALLAMILAASAVGLLWRLLPKVRA